MFKSNHFKSVQRLAVLLLLVLPLSLFAQESRVVKGKVLDEKGLPLPGASVFVDQTIAAESGIKGVVTNYNMGTVSDVNGNFSLTIPKNVTAITCSFISFETQKVNVAGKSVVEIRLKENNTAIEEVVVTGYQNIKQRKNTSSVAKIESKDIKQVGIASVDQMLSGQIAGVQVTNVSGAPGSAAKIRIRGTASLSGSQDPLWVLDGMPLEGTNLPVMTDKNLDELTNSSIAGLNPNDIASITILKDAAATAIYGTRAANGVILITTKTGKKGKLDINLSSNVSITLRPNFDKLNLLNSNQKIDWELDLAKRSDITYRKDMGAVGRILTKSGEYDAYQQNGFSALSSQTQEAINALRNTNTNWGNEMYQRAVNQDHSLSISGGDDRAKYYFSVGYYDEKGSTIGTGLNRFNLTLKTDYQLTNKLNIGVSVFTNQKKQDSYLLSARQFTNPSRYSRTANPYQPVRDEKGNFVYDPNIQGEQDKFVDFNAIEERENTSNILKTQSLNSIFDARWDITEDIKYTSQFGMQYDLLNTEQIAFENTYYARFARAKSQYKDKVTNEPGLFIPEGGIIKNGEDRSNQWNWKNMLELNKRVNDVHEIDLMVGSELRRTYNRRVNTAGYGYNPRTLVTVPVIFPDQSREREFPLFRKTMSENAFVSFFSTASYTYDRRYTVFGSVRYDGSDLYGVDPKYKYLPLWSVGGAWNALEEKLMKDISWLSTLKLRASYGLQGNIDKSTSPFLIGEYKTTSILPGVTEDNLNVLNPPNGLLRWEKTATWNGGVDFGVLRNRILVGVDLYKRVSSDLIGVRSIPLETGFNFAPQNWAQVTNKGVEFNITTQNIQSKNFSWVTNFNISKNINNVDKYQVREDATTASLQGHPVNSIFAFKTAGLDQDGYPLFWKDGKKISVNDFFKLDALWGIPELTSSKLTPKELRESYSYMGSADPKLSGGFINTLRYKGVTLNMSMSFNIKQWVREAPFYNMAQYERSENTTSRINEIWSPTNKTGKYPAIVGADSYGGSRAGEYFFLSDGELSKFIFPNLDIWCREISYVRVNSIRLSYDLPESLVKRLRVSAIKLNLEARNPFVFGTNYKGFFDPETYGNIYAQPLPRMLSMGLNVNF